ncbi:MAG: L,D-transpeptidase [Chthoniobacterales bacterium]
MRWCWVYLLAVVAFVHTASAQEAGRYAIEIDLQDQLAYLIEDGGVVLTTPISSGRGGHFTTSGRFKMTQKERNHLSNMYGKIVDARGHTIVADADSDMRVPRGGRFVPAPMRYFMRFNGAEGMHAGYLPGRPASHGCVRLPEENAIALFETVPVGTPVTVFGNTAHSSRTRENRRPRRAELQWTRHAEPAVFRWSGGLALGRNAAASYARLRRAKGGRRSSWGHSWVPTSRPASES